ncbi:MAG: ABC transporter ATP-binding protein [Pirellulaceae bacterium]|nr:ABC transporter ATP-binding protein [Pirellulaceae bacterium]
MKSAIVCSKLTKRYDGRPPVEAVRGVDLAVDVGECFGLLGPNGAGKTTTMEILEGLLDATSGQVEILGHHWGRDDAAIRQLIGISLQETQLSEKLSVRETVALFRSFYPSGLTPEEAIGRVSLEDKSNAWIKTLSGGQKQRLAVALAIVGDPQILFLDEPTTGLDPQSRRQLWEIIHAFRKSGRTIMLTTHYMDEAERLCDRVAVVDQGKVIALGSPKELISQLGGEHVVDFALSDGAAIADEELKQVASVNTVRTDAGTFSLSVSEPHLAIPSLLSLLKSRGSELSTLTTRHATLEDVFVSLTGRHLQAEGEEDKKK